MNFTIQSDTPGTIRTIKKTAGGATGGRFYNFNEDSGTNAAMTLKDLSIQGSDSVITNAIGLFFHSTTPAATVDMTIDNVTFSGFQNGKYRGGVISMERDGNVLNITAANSLVFDSNLTNAAYGGAISMDNTGKLTITGDTIKFNNNYAKTYGGAIHGHNTTITGNVVKFTNNTADTEHGGAVNLYGGTLRITGTGVNPKIEFSGNTAGKNSGAIRGFSIFFENGAFTFANNTAGQNGGAIFSETAVTFSGDDTSAVFTGNTAGANGNDLYLYGSSGTVLSFTDSGTYSFDGGIYVDKENVQTVINEALVTIAGRANDSTNNYQLRNVTISNGGKLTANLDNIDKIENTTITLNGTESQVELYNALLNQVASIKSDTGAGTFDLEYSAANGAVQNESLVISSGRIDVKGYMEGGITVDANGVFSPGNSVGEAKFGGGYELYDGAKLLIEMDETGIDSLIASSFTENNGIIELAIDGIPFGSQYDVITATDGFSGSQDEAYWLGKFGTLPDYLTLSVVDGVYGANSQTVRLSIDRNAVPEPSTWALLLLGAAGLMYVRKRTRK